MYIDSQGTVVVAGRARAVVVGVGANTAMGSIRDSMLRTDDVRIINFWFSSLLHIQLCVVLECLVCRHIFYSVFILIFCLLNVSFSPWKWLWNFQICSLYNWIEVEPYSCDYGVNELYILIVFPTGVHSNFLFLKLLCRKWRHWRKSWMNLVLFWLRLSQISCTPFHFVCM